MFGTNDTPAQPPGSILTSRLTTDSTLRSPSHENHKMRREEGQAYQKGNYTMLENILNQL